MSIYAAVRGIILTIQRKPKSHFPKLNNILSIGLGILCPPVFSNFGRCEITKNRFHILCSPQFLYIELYLNVYISVNVNSNVYAHVYVHVYVNVNVYFKKSIHVQIHEYV